MKIQKTPSVLFVAVLAYAMWVSLPLRVSPTRVQAAEDSSFVAQVIRHVNTNRKVIALTFDDGPSRTYTPQVLNLLQQYHARATFFVIGNRATEYPDLIRQELSLRNEVANHTFSHVIVQHQSNGQVESELSKAHQAFVAITKSGEAHFFRPPRGRYDQRVLRIAEENGYSIVLWSVDSEDWSNPGTGQIVKKVLKNVHPGDILLFHDQGGNRSQTIQALSAILPTLKSRGYQIVTVSELLSLKDSDPLK